MSRRTVLLINKFYHDVGPAGGVGRYLLQEEAALRERGWDVVPFAMADADARPSPWRRFFTPAHDYRRARWSAAAPAQALSLIWNREAARWLDRLLREVRPDVAHLHNVYHHLSPAILPVLARHGVPAVMTLHDLRLLCPAIHMRRDGGICERCRGGRWHQAVLGRCVKGSRAASLLAAVETAHQTLRRLYPRHVRVFLCPSRFLADKYAEWGWPADRLRHLPNFVDVEAWRPDGAPDPDRYLFFGRLSDEKGLPTLLAAHARWEAEDHDAPELRLAGAGPAAEALRRLAGELGLRRVRFLGPLDADALRAEAAAAAFTVLPSECYENGPLSLLESLAAGAPVAGTDLGGIPEHLDDGVDGVLCRPGDSGDLLRALRAARALPPSAREKARAKAVARFGREAHMDELAGILMDPGELP